jgi:outer membrane lipoprotein-sorting protein
MTAKLNQQGMEIPIEIVQLKGGKQFTSFSFQGMEIKQGVFDGETLWSTNMTNMQPEKSDSETTENVKLSKEDFPSALLNYKEKGYSVELIGNETIDGADTFKIKLTKKPLTVDGNSVDDITFFYFDTENFVPIAIESEVKMGPAKGMVQLITMSDYQEVDGLYFPFSMSQGVKGQPGQPMAFDTIELNPEVDESIFLFPEPATTGED